MFSGAGALTTTNMVTLNDETDPGAEHAEHTETESAVNPDPHTEVPSLDALSLERSILTLVKDANTTADELIEAKPTSAMLSERDSEGRSVLWWLALNPRQLKSIIAFDRQGLITNEMLLASPYPKPKSSITYTNPIQLLFYFSDPVKLKEHFFKWCLDDTLVRYFFRDFYCLNFEGGASHYEAPFLKHMISTSDAPILLDIINKIKLQDLESTVNWQGENYNLIMAVIVKALNSCNPDTYDSPLAEMDFEVRAAAELTRKEKSTSGEIASYQLFCRLLEVGPGRKPLITPNLINLNLVVPKVFSPLAHHVRFVHHRFENLFPPHFKKIVVALHMIHQMKERELFPRNNPFERATIRKVTDEFENECRMRIEGLLDTNSFDLSKLTPKDILPEAYHDFASMVFAHDYALNYFLPNVLVTYREENKTKLIDQTIQGMQDHLSSIPGGYLIAQSSRLDDFRERVGQVYDQCCKEHNKIYHARISRFLVPLMMQFCHEHKLSFEAMDKGAIEQCIVAAASQDLKQIKAPTVQSKQEDKPPQPIAASMSLDESTLTAIREIRDVFYLCVPDQIEVYYFAKSRIPRTNNVYAQVVVEDIFKNNNTMKNNLYGAFPDLIRGWISSILRDKHKTFTFSVYEGLLAEYQEKQRQELPNLIEHWAEQTRRAYKKMNPVTMNPYTSPTDTGSAFKQMMIKGIRDYMEAHPGLIIRRAAMIEVSGRILKNRGKLCLDTIRKILDHVLFPRSSVSPSALNSMSLLPPPVTRPVDSLSSSVQHLSEKKPRIG